MSEQNLSEKELWFFGWLLCYFSIYLLILTGSFREKIVIGFISGAQSGCLKIGRLGRWSLP